MPTRLSGRMLQRMINAFAHLPGVSSTSLSAGDHGIIAGDDSHPAESALVSTGGKAARDLGLGTLDEAWVEGRGALLVAPIGELSVLRIHIEESKAIGRVSHELRRSREMIEELQR